MFRPALVGVSLKKYCKQLKCTLIEVKRRDSGTLEHYAAVKKNEIVDTH